MPDSSRGFVTNENDASLTVIDCVKHEPLRTIALGEGLKPMGTALARDGSRLYVSTGRGGKVLTVDTASEKVIASVDAGVRPWGIALSPDEKYLFSANGPSNDVSVIDLATNAVVRKVPAGERPWGVLVISQ
jgi:YVTN family beta-propeller protein